MLKVNIYTSTINGRVKKPYLISVDGFEHTAIAQLKVSEEEFWARLGKALGMKFMDAPVNEGTNPTK